MARVVVLQHGAERTPGRLGLTLRDHAFKLDTRRVDLPADQGGDPLPPDLDDVHGLLVLGGSQSVDQNLPWIAREQELIRVAHEAGLPVVGICLGAQMIAKALGGTVTRMEKPEVGFRKVRILPPGQTETILAGIPWESLQYLSHQEEISELPPGAQLLASSDACKTQIFRAGQRTYGFQFHFELDRPGIDRLAAEEAEMLDRAEVSQSQISVEAEEHYERFGLIADRLCVNLATFAFPFSELLSV
jgi:GMP synthase (glutamine-hydrolysing)